LLRDQEGGPPQIKDKKSKTKPTAGTGKTGKGKVVSGSGDEYVEEKDDDDMPPPPSGGGSGVEIADSTKEVRAGQLKASQDTETGTKQRRVNKRLKDYEAKDDANDGSGGANKKDS